MFKRVNFLAVWAGQVVSLFGSNLSGFALGVWLYQQTGSASNFALVALCTALPQMLLSPLAGVLIDRYNRRWVMAIADSGAAICTLCLGILFWTGRIQVWHIFTATTISSAFGAFQVPAYSALVASVIQRRQLGRANGLIQFGQAMADILAPSLAGLLVVTVGVSGVLLIDLTTFCFAVLTLTLARFPQQESTPQAQGPQESTRRPWRDELQTGWDALRASPGLFNLLRYQALFSFLWNLFAVLVVPMILGFADPDGLGLALTIASAGLLIGSVLMTAWGGPKRLLSGLLVFELISAAGFCLMSLRPNLILVAVAAFVAHWSLAFVSSLSEAIWQSQVERPMQGRIFAFKQAVIKAATLLAYVVAGGLADRFLDPLLRPGCAWASGLGSWFGVGPGRGIALLFFLIGLVKALAVMWVYLSPGAKALDRSLLAENIEGHA